jgi:hypothetical protein
MLFMPPASQARTVYIPRVFVPRQPTHSVTLVDALWTVVGVGTAVWLAAQGFQAIVSEPRDTYKYLYLHKGRARHGGITNNLARREREHRVRWRDGTIHRVGRRVTRSSALAWERQHGF